jgi:hypothetical protein
MWRFGRFKAFGFGLWIFMFLSFYLQCATSIPYYLAMVAFLGVGTDNGLHAVRYVFLIGCVPSLLTFSLFCRASGSGYSSDFC